MFSESSALYDKIYTRLKYYEQESETVSTWIKKLRPNTRSILDVACGTGEHARFLSADYRVDGIDLNEEFIRIARSKNPDGEYRAADMIDLNIGKRYDAIVCLFSSIGYVRTIENLNKTIAGFERHLNDDGIIIVEPWFTPSTWNRGVLHMTAVDEPEFKVCRMNISDATDGRLSFFKFHYLVGTPGGVTHFTEDHSLGLFTVAEMKAAFEACRLRVQYDDHGIFGRGLYIAERR